jgi:galactokinase
VKPGTRHRSESPAARRGRLRAAFASAFPGTGAARPDLEFYRAPGSVNLIGGHTDYNDGLVLPAAIGLDTWLVVRRRRDSLVRVVSLQAGLAGTGGTGAPTSGATARASGKSRGRFWVDELAPPDQGQRRAEAGWLDYVAATAWSLREAGLPVQGFDGVIDSSLPPGAGLGSSAALELAVALALLGSAPVAGPPTLAALAQRAERDFLGIDCEIVDQYASAAGLASRAMLLDCRSLESRAVALPSGVRVVVCDTRSPRYPHMDTFDERRAECGRAVALLAERAPSISSLRDVDRATLRRLRRVLPDVVARRAEHVVTENERVAAAATAMAVGDLPELGRLFAASHESLRRNYEVSSPALDAMVDIATHVRGVIGARMTGPGFGGCTVNLVSEHAVADLERAVADEYPRRTGLEAKVYPVAISDGAGKV